MNGTVFLAGWLRENLYAGIQNFLAPHDQFRLSAAEHGGKHFFQMDINLVYSFQQSFVAFLGLSDELHFAGSPTLPANPATVSPDKSYVTGKTANSSSAPGFTAPKAAISEFSRVISACKAEGFVFPSSLYQFLLMSPGFF